MQNYWSVHENRTSAGEKIKSFSESLAQLEFLKLFSGCLIAFEGFAGYFFVYPLNLYDIAE